MKNLIQIVDTYLSQNTEYAIQITGNWGVGKTYFYRELLAARIKTTMLPSNARKRYRPIYVSLFGIKNADEVALKIVSELYAAKVLEVTGKVVSLKKQ